MPESEGNALTRPIAEITTEDVISWGDAIIRARIVRKVESGGFLTGTERDYISENPPTRRKIRGGQLKTERDLEVAVAHLFIKKERRGKKERGKKITDELLKYVNSDAGEANKEKTVYAALGRGYKKLLSLCSLDSSLSEDEREMTLFILNMIKEYAPKRWAIEAEKRL